MYIKHCKTSYSNPNLTLDLFWKNEMNCLAVTIKWKNTTHDLHEF